MDAGTTPEAVFSSLYSLRYPFFIDSPGRRGPDCRLQILGAEPFMTISGRAGCTILRSENGITSLKADPLEVIDSHLAELRTIAEPGHAFRGCAAGYVGYSYKNAIEKNIIYRDTGAGDDVFFAFYDTIFFFDKKTGEAKIISAKIPGGPSPVDRAKYFKELLGPERKSLKIKGASITPQENDGSYIKKAKRVKEYIAAGDIYQANLSRKYFIEGAGDDYYSLYMNLRRANPSPFSLFFDAGDAKILSTSPERFFRKTGRLISTVPIKGTIRASYPTGSAMRRLFASEKDRAELIMITDLERNDLGKIAITGSVKPHRLYTLRRFGNIIHMMSDIRAIIDENKAFSDIIKALHPGGSITGAPKIRAMQILDELEDEPRTLYTGTAGYIDFSGRMDFNILIRTVFAENGGLYYSAGGGIVHDSVPEKENREIRQKSLGILRGLGKA